MLDSKPQPNGMHTVYTCFQDPAYQVAVNLSNGAVGGTKGTPSLEDQAACTVGYAFVDAPTTQYIVAVGQGEICTDGDGCPLKVQNVFCAPTIVGQTGYKLVKIVGLGDVPQSTNLNPLSCEDGPGAYPIHTVEVRVRNGGNKAELVCHFDVSGTISFEVTPVCP